MISRREFVILTSAAAIWPPAAGAQQPERIRRVGMLMSQREGDQEAIDRYAAIREGLEKLGWFEGRNIRIDRRFAGGSGESMQAYAAELVRLAPDVIIAAATAALAALQRQTKTIPIVFAQVTDPVGAGFVESLARPGGNITGFTQHEFSIAEKWMELLKELAPRTDHIAVLYDPLNPATAGYLSAIKSAAPALRMQVSDHTVLDNPDIERAIGAAADRPAGGLLVLPGPSPSVRRDLVIALAERHRLPAVYPFRYWVARGGLAFYGIDNIDLYRLAASYVDRILRGEKPAELPVQNANKFELVINLKTAKALGLTVPQSIFARADEVIE